MADKTPAQLLREIADQIEDTDLKMVSMIMAVGHGEVDGWDGVRAGHPTGARRLSISLLMDSQEQWKEFWAWFGAQQREGFPTHSPEIVEPF